MATDRLTILPLPVCLNNLPLPTTSIFGEREGRINILICLLMPQKQVQQACSVSLAWFALELTTGRSVFLLVLGAETGYLLCFPHVWHFRTMLSAHGFLPPLLLFSTVVVHDCPSIKTESQNLHMVRFTAGLSRILVLRDTARKSVASRLPIPCKGDGVDSKDGSDGGDAAEVRKTEAC